MIQPDYKTFTRLARQGNLVPVCESFTADLLTPVGAYLRLANQARYSCLLESVEGGETIARYTFVGANPAEVFRVRGRICVIEREGPRGVEWKFGRASPSKYCVGAFGGTSLCAFRVCRRW